MFIKEFSRCYFPRTFMFLDSSKDQILREYKTLKRLGLKTIISGLVGTISDWQEKLPVQKARSCKIDGLKFSVLQDILDCFEKERTPFSQGGHSLYLSPEQWKKSIFAPLAKEYPLMAGLKIMKRLGGLNTPYLYTKGHSRIQAKFIPSHRHQILTMNGLYILGVAPRLYDLLEIEGGESSCIAYVVQHIEGDVPQAEECEEAVSKLKTLVDKGTLQLINTTGFEHPDFKCPEYNGNVIKDKKTKKIFFIDIQNFKFAHYDNFLKDIASKARDDSHFGSKSYLLGGKHLYQSIPSLNIPANRNPEKRIEEIMSLLEENNITIKEKTILDIGCNLGLTSAQYLRHGAKWVHGWDFEKVINHAEHVLLSIGCTRFSLTGKKLDTNSNIIDDIPCFLRDKEVIISYLAIRQHIGWIKDLARIKWRYMIYEGHQRESEEDTIGFFRELNIIVKTKILVQGTIKDSNSDSRIIAIIQRL